MDVWTQDRESAAKYRVNWIHGKQGQGLGRDCIHFGGNSGYQAINLAYLWGANRIILLGFDMRRVDNRAHWFGDHPRAKGFHNPVAFEHWIRMFDGLARDLKREGVEVINCTPGSALRCFATNDIHRIA